MSSWISLIRSIIHAQRSKKRESRTKSQENRNRQPNQAKILEVTQAFSDTMPQTNQFLSFRLDSWLLTLDSLHKLNQPFKCNSYDNLPTQKRIAVT